MSVVRRSIHSKSVDDDDIHALLTFKSGLGGHMDTCWSVRAFRLSQLSIKTHGTNGNIMLTDHELRIESDREESKAQLFHNQSFDCVRF
ncbi:MAG: hypothetical protein ABSE39_11480 [Candidatus Bathyarchaeia archaeon]|jgi:predicted dehydrogenase